MLELPPVPSLGVPPEPYAVSVPPVCDQTEKPGVQAFRSFVLCRSEPWRDLGILRPCSVGHPSDHHAGMAWDWAAQAAIPEDAEMAAELLDWLLSADPDGNLDAMYRRVGLTYIIWDGYLFSSRTRSWQPYSGSSPHRDHVHFSFGHDGAFGQTSFYGWLGAEGAEPVEQNKAPTEPATRASPLLAALGGLAAGGLGGYHIGRALSRRLPFARAPRPGGP
jgi:hypothetical protein